MRRTQQKLWVWGWFAGVLALVPSAARAQVVSPFQLLDDEPENVYLNQPVPKTEQLTNTGGVHFALEIDYNSAYMYRGVDQSTPPLVNEHALQFDGRLTWDLGKLPHPFIGLFSNIFNNDPVSQFEEIRPYAGLEWSVRPITVAAGFNGYIYPNRKGLDTQEIWVSISANDSRLFHEAEPVLQPYVYGAYDFDKYDGFYLEAGIRHDFVLWETGVVLSAVGDFAYVAHNRYFLGTGPLAHETGFQHYDVGAILSYDAGRALGIPLRYGQWLIKGYLYYTGPVEAGLRADSRVWGGVGLEFKY